MIVQPRRDVVVLAAGMGLRLSEISLGLPKALVSVAGVPLLDRALHFAIALSPHGRRFVVGGYRFDAICDHQKKNGIAYDLYHNPDFKSGNLFSLMSVLPEITNDFYLLNADHIFAPESASHFTPEHLEMVTVFADIDRPLYIDDMKIKLSSSGTVSSISKTLTEYDCGYIGVSYIPETCISRYRESCRLVSNSDPTTANVEKVIQSLTDHGAGVFCQVVGNLQWFEVDTPADFEIANRNLSNQ